MLLSSSLPIKGTFRCDDGEGNENFKKNSRFDQQNNNFARAAHVSYFNLSSMHDYNVTFVTFARLRRDIRDVLRRT